MLTRTTITEDELEARSAGGDGLHVLVISPEFYGSAPLPESGTLLIGRAAKADLLIDDPLASRQHARLLVDPVLAVEDLGSANGTRVREVLVSPHQAVPIAHGDPIGIGSTVLLVQGGRWSTGRRRIWSHAQFETRLRDECGRATTGAPFSLLRVRLEEQVPWTRVFPTLVRHLVPPHLCAPYAPGEYEALVFGSEPGPIQALVEALRADLHSTHVPARLAVATYPRDGRTADALMARANAGLRPVPVKTTVPGLRTPSQATQRIYDMAARAAATNINVLLLGETGAGKEVLARMIHQLSGRAGKPMVSLNCAGLPESLIESELFGHERGAFTGAVQAREGLLESAHGGTVFLDEIGEMPPRIQATLLRVLESREVLPVGGRRPRSIDVRFMAATNRDLEADSARGAFRQDLFFRLNGMALQLPPLRDRRSEIPELARTFVAQSCTDIAKPEPLISMATLALLQGYAWPGNIRELKNVMERAVVLCDGTEILPEHLPVEKMGSPPPDQPGNDSAPEALANQGQDDERQRIIEALSACAGNQSRAAKRLGMPRRTFVTKLDLHGIPRPQKVLKHDD